MPKRIIDADAMWQSDKLARCQQGSIPEYAWLYGVADAYGNFELTNPRVLHGKAYAPIRQSFSVKDLERVLADFERHGLLYTWFEGLKKYGHWTGSWKTGRLPPERHRDRYAGNLEVKKLYDTSGKPEPGLQEYLDRTAIEALSEPEKQRQLPLAKELNSQAGAAVDETQARARQQAKDDELLKIATWHTLQSEYPPDRLTREDYCQKFILALPVTEMTPLLEGFRRWKLSKTWHDGYIQNSDNFLDDRKWTKTPTEVNGNGRKLQGPAGRTTEDHRERMRKNAKTLGLDRP